MNKSLPIFTGIEGTRIIGRRGMTRNIHDVLEETQHLQRYSEDLTLMSDIGIRTFRPEIPWHYIEKIRGTYDWEWMDAYMNKVHELGIDPIMDPLHHTSFPTWLKD